MKRYTNLLVDLFILKYLFFSLFGVTKKEKNFYTHTHTHTHTHIYICIYIYTLIILNTYF